MFRPMTDKVPDDSVDVRILQLKTRLWAAQRNIQAAREAVAVKQVCLDGWLREEKRLRDELDALVDAQVGKVKLNDTESK